MNFTSVSPRASLLPLIMAVVLLGVPMIVGIGYLIAGASGVVGNAAPGAVGRVIADAQVWRSLLLSLWIALLGTALSVSGAVCVALLFAGNERVDRAMRVITALPLPVPTVAAAVATLLLLSQSGWLSRVATQLHLIATPAEFPAIVTDPWAIGVIAAVVWKEMPFLALVALSLQSLRGHAMSDTARTLGASRWQTLRTITLPMLLRGMAPSIIAVFVFVLGSLELAMILAPSAPLALPLLIQERRTALDMASHGEAYVIALLATVVALLAVLMHESLREDA